MSRYGLTLLLALVFCGTATSAQIYVPDNYPSIQSAIDAAANGDVITVRPGTYRENIDFDGKIILVGSEMGPAATVIDGKQAGPVVTFDRLEPAATILTGFTITNGSSPAEGGGISVNESAPTIINNLITGNESDVGGGIWCYGVYSTAQIVGNVIAGNTAFSHGGGIYSERNSELTVTDNRIVDNVATWYGGGINCYHESLALIQDNVISGNRAVLGDGAGIACRLGSQATITNNTITDNRSEWWGGGIYCEDCSPSIVNNTITANSAGFFGGGICLFQTAAPTITNTIVWGNSAPRGQSITAFPTCAPVVTFCDIEAGWTGTGNIDADPLFADTSLGDYHLTHPSPCRDAGDNAAVQSLLKDDFEGDPRISAGTVDMGIDEFHPRLYKIGSVVPGNQILIRTVGAPAAPVTLLYGSGVLWIPKTTPHGKLHLATPLLWQGLIGTIPQSGILSVPVTVPAGWQSGQEHPFQALEGTWGNPGTVLTNLMLLDVE